MSFITNIRSVAKYENKLLLRSWFFRIFAILAALILGIFNGVSFFADDAGSMWALTSIPGNIPYFSLLLLNTGQAVVAIFLASDFLKRDKKLDTSEVFYVHPLSNAEYVFGKIWGNLRAFLILNVLVMGMVMAFNFAAPGVSVDWMAYIIYFLLICVPTLIFIIGFSIFLMLVIRNQALTFVILLGYIGLTVFYIGSKFYYLFDYMAYSLPLVRSTIVGFSNWETILNHRSIYLLAGLAFTCFTIAMFNRLPNSRRSSLPWIVGGIMLTGAAAYCGYSHVTTFTGAARQRAAYTEVNNTYVHHPRMAVDRYAMHVRQLPDEVAVQVNMQAVPLTAAREYVFCLNPGLTVTGVESNGQPVNFRRDNQIIIAAFDRELTPNDTVPLTIAYNGRVDENFCYLDIPAEQLEEQKKALILNVDKRYVFQTPDYLLFTPETYWYPRPGVAYSDKHPDWQQSYFSHFDVTIETLPGLTAITQGTEQIDSLAQAAPAAAVAATDTVHATDSVTVPAAKPHIYRYVSDDRMHSSSLTIGRYGRASAMADGVEFNIRYLEGHDYFRALMDSVKDTIPTFIGEAKQRFERNNKLKYPFRRFSLVEVPAQFKSYARAWSQQQEAVQPEMVLFEEMGWSTWEADLKGMVKNQKRWAKWNGEELDDNEALRRSFRNFLWLFQYAEGDNRVERGSRGRYELKTERNPYYLYPQLYNFKYNIFSTHWPIANRLIEIYLQNNIATQDWERQINGVSNNERASLLFAQQPFTELLADPKQTEIMDNMLALRGRLLMGPGELKIGTSSFRDSVYSLIGRNVFSNLSLEAMLDTLSAYADTTLHEEIARWAAPIDLPYYSMSQPELVHHSNRGKDDFVLRFRVANDSPHDGMINIYIRAGQWWANTPTDREQFNAIIPAGETHEFVSVWEQQPGSVQINTLASSNLPGLVNMNIRNVRRESAPMRAQEGVFRVDGIILNDSTEIVVDNEDELFSISKPSVSGLLPRWLDRIEDEGFKYQGVWWNTPFEWTPTTGAGFYGKYVRSAHVIRNGDGKKTATWTVPLKGAGYYEVYYWAYNERLRWSRDRNFEYHFKFRYDDQNEDVYLNLRHAGDEWAHMGTYYFDSDTLRIDLTNESKLRMITADAVKLVKR